MADYYVDSNASDDTGDGSFGDPWRDWWVHVNSLSASDTLHFRGGSEGFPQLYVQTADGDITVDGSDGNPITLQPYGAEYVEIRASSPYRTFDIAGDYITINGKDQLVIDKNGNTSTYIVDMGGVYNKLLDCVLHNVTNCNNAVRIVGDYCTVTGNTIYNIYNDDTSDGQGIAIYGAQYAEVADNTIYDCYGDCLQINDDPAITADGTTIHDNLMYTTLGECSENALDLKIGGASGNPVLIYNNTIYGFRACTSTCGGSGSTKGEGVTLHNITDYVDVYDNLIYDCTSFLHVSENAQYINVYRNVMYDMKTDAEDPNSSGEKGLYIWGDYINIWNNVIEDCPSDQDFLAFHPTGCSNVVLQNNIFKDVGLISNEDAVGISYSYNCWYNAGETLSGTGDVTDDPLFTNEAGHDYTLQETSPCIDAGTDVGLPYSGANPDMGAFEIEYSPSLSPSASASPSGTPSPSPSLSETPSASASESASESPSPSSSESLSASPSLSPSASASASFSGSASPSESPSASASSSASLSPSTSESPSASVSASASESPSLSPSASESPSVSLSASPSASGSASDSPSLSPSASASPSASESPSPVAASIGGIRVLIGDRFGRVIGEVTPSIGAISWRLNSIGRVILTFSKNDAKTTEAMLRHGNRVLIQFSSDIGLPDWGGVLDPPRTWGADTVAVSCYGIEYMLQFRITGKIRAFDSVPVGSIFHALLTETQFDGPMGITFGRIWTGGRMHHPRFHFKNLWDIIVNDLLPMENCDIQFVPYLEAGYIKFRAEIYEKLGEDKSARQQLKEGVNVSSAGLSEQGPLVNSFTSIGAGTGWGDDRGTSISVDRDSGNLYGLRQGSEIYSKVTLATTLERYSNTVVEQGSSPHTRPTVSAVNKPPALFSAYGIGDYLRCVLPTYGFGGYNAVVRVLAREYNVQNKECKLVTEERFQPTVRFAGIGGVETS